ncbi:MAG: non-canonical purine NTP pyrophosphatase [Gaiellaceae bacterium]
MDRVVLASRNPHKLEELRALLPGWPLEPIAAELPPETGETYDENARAKAAFAWRPGSWALGEDSGIEVDALGGGPGIRSARYAEDPVAQLLADLEGVAGREARYVCELVLLTPQGEELQGSGVLMGHIARKARGSEGFGYDPVFVPAGEERTVAELGNEWKREHSHRAVAARALREAGDVVGA